MRVGKFLFVLCISILVSGCGLPILTKSESQQADDRIEAKYGLAKLGQIKWSEAYEFAFNETMAGPDYSTRYIDLDYFSRLIDIAKKAEAGQMSQDEVDSAKRQLTVARQQALAPHKEAARRAQADALRAVSRSLATQPPLQFQPVPVQPRNTLNCTTTYVGNQAYTNCN